MNSRVLVFSPQAKLIREINLAKSEYSFDRAMAIAIDKKVLYVADSLKHRIRRFTLQGKWLGDINLTAPIPKPVPEPEAVDSEKSKAEVKTEISTALPEAVALLIRDDELIYADRRWHRICFLELPSGKEKRCMGKRGEMEGQFEYPFQLSLDRDGYLNVVDVLNARVQIFDRSGKYYSQTGRLSMHRMYRPNGNVFDVLDFQYVSDSYLGTVSIYKHGRFLGLLQDVSGKVIKFKTPTRLYYHPSGYLYVVDAQDHKVQKIELDYQALKNIPENEGDISRKKCVVCHYTWGNEDGNDKLDDSQDVLPVGSLNMCYSCHHGVVLDSRQAIPFGAQHPTVYDPEKKKQDYYKKPLRDDEIPEVYPHSKKNDLNCTSCHTPHSDNVDQPNLYTENHNAWLRGADYGSAQCEACHESNAKDSGRKDAKKIGMNHPLGVKMLKPAKKGQHLSTDDPHLQKGLPKLLQAGGGVLLEEDAIGCQSCHQVHEGATKNLLT